MKKLSLLSFVALAVALPVQAQDLTFTLKNRSGSTLVEFYASPVDVRDWEEDILGVDVLESGSSVRITVADDRTQCEYDLRLVWDDGEVTEEAAANLCETGSFTLE